MADQFPTFQEWLAEHTDASPATQAIARELLERKDVVMARVLSSRHQLDRLIGRANSCDRRPF